MLQNPKKNTLAIMVTHTYGEPFESLKENFSSIMREEASRHNIDVYYIRGKKPSSINRILEQLSNSLRYSKFWPLQRIIDCATLLPYNFRRPKIVVNGWELGSSNEEGLRTLGAKVMSGLLHLSKNYKYVIKTTNSSLFNFPMLLQAIDAFEADPKTSVYAGSVINFNSKKPFVSGANLLLNRNAIEVLASNAKFWMHGDLDDVAIGRIMRRNNIPIRKLTTLNVDALESLRSTPDSLLAETQHFRCKSSSNPRNDLEIMKEISRRLSYTKLA